MRSVGVALALAACGPVYETRFELSPPPDNPNWAACVAGCEVQRSACIQRADQQFLDCRRRAQLDSLSCFGGRDRFGRYDGFPPFGCDRPLCYNDRGSCDAGYVACYEGCGGTVTETRVCVERCEPPAQTTPPP